MSFPEQPFGFVAGRWVLSIGDTPDDADRAPDYVPVKDGGVVFTPQVTHRVATDGSGWAGIIKDRVFASVGERGQLIDAEGHDHLALAVGVYSVSYDFGLDKSWPSHYIEVKPEHTASAPLWLPPIAPAPEGPRIENRVVTIPADGEDGQVLVWDGGGFSWMDAPEGPRGPKGDLDAEQLAGAPRLTNRSHNTTWAVPANESSTIHSQTPRLVKFTATAPDGYIRENIPLTNRQRYYFTAEMKATSNLVYFGSSVAPVYHSGSGDWERLSGTVTTGDVNLFFQARDQRPSGWDQIEVRDPVLINLTEVFGAGREPSKEYMDALLAKHGHYIGAVDQFAVGDALQALTVAGPGMTLRHDTSVGTRVFLDHPGGSTMLYGDTGWRNVQSLLEPGWELDPTVGYFRLRRTTHTVEMIGRLIVTPDAEFIGNSRSAAQMVIRLPYGFATFPTYAPMGTARSRRENMQINGDGPYRMRVSGETGTWEAGDLLTFTMSAPTHVDWPTTLPGTPA